MTGAALVLLLLPTAIRTEGAVVLAGVGGALLTVVAGFAVLPLCVGRVHLTGTLLTARTVRGRRTLDLSRLETVGGYQLRTRDGSYDYLSLRDDDGTWLLLTGRPGFPAERGRGGAASTVVHRAARDAVLRGEVAGVSQAARAVLGLPSHHDLGETVFALSCWVIFLCAFAAAGLVPMALWSLVVPL